MTMDAGSWTLRPAGPADEPFLLALYVDVRAAEFQGMGWPPEVLSAFLADQWRMQTRAYAHAHPQADLSIVEQDGVAVGRLLLSRTSSDHRIVDISLMSHVRGRGLGGQVLAGVCDRADAQGCTVSLSVLTTSRAQTLYRRLGFVPVDDGEPYRQMVRPRPAC
ncbi:GNAT family N-acetyltransferase [Brevundimonas sp.]|uniref:GNAT family N-acetyltransferase n=1 Tax=Brevundimonas sp. TaxID=1871086 RepID=UPI002ABBB3A6|nr:GNAT family N-acetyltransferase [Brevundimonas sp.]MDZ4363864.1 GNAT family N-acetyltransferase [Brevundimonas sp.]